MGEGVGNCDAMRRKRYDESIEEEEPSVGQWMMA